MCAVREAEAANLQSRGSQKYEAGLLYIGTMGISKAPDKGSAPSGQHDRSPALPGAGGRPRPKPYPPFLLRDRPRPEPTFPLHQPWLQIQASVSTPSSPSLVYFEKRPSDLYLPRQSCGEGGLYIKKRPSDLHCLRQSCGAGAGRSL